jgi:hypothetical protein
VSLVLLLLLLRESFLPARDSVFPSTKSDRERVFFVSGRVVERLRGGRKGTLSPVTGTESRTTVERAGQLEARMRNERKREWSGEGN